MQVFSHLRQFQRWTKRQSDRLYRLKTLRRHVNRQHPAFELRGHCILVHSLRFSLFPLRSSRSSRCQVAKEAHLLRRTDISPVFCTGQQRVRYFLKFLGPSARRAIRPQLFVSTAPLLQALRCFMFKFTLRGRFIANSVVDNNEFVFLEFAAYVNQTGYSIASLVSAATPSQALAWALGFFGTLIFLLTASHSSEGARGCSN